jgi:hypothetical protein
LDTEKASLETLEARVTASGLGDRDIETAMIAASLHNEGWKVRAPWFRGGQWWFEKDGRRLSLTAVKNLLRVAALNEATCEECKSPIRNVGLRRGPRVDRRYCSNACKQKAYYKRKRARTVPPSVPPSPSEKRD